MGCDIHSYVEKYDSMDDDWKVEVGFQTNWEYASGLCDELISSRDYFLFALLAGVRRGQNNVPQIDDCRGLPYDVSEVVSEERESWDQDAHSTSWYDAKELMEYISNEDNYNLLNDKFPGYGWEWLFTIGLGQLVERSESDGSDIRIIFWFDN